MYSQSVNRSRVLAWPRILGGSCRAMAACALATIGLVVVLSGPAAAQSGSWNVDAAGSWSLNTNWNPTAVPGNAAGDVVGLTNNITSNRIVTIDTTPRTVGTLNIGDANNTHGFQLSSSGGATLTFSNSGSSATVNEFGSVGDFLAARVILADNLVFNVQGSLGLSGTVSEVGGVRSLTKAGPGILTPNRPNSYTGPTVILGGTLALGTISSGGATSPIGASGDEAENLVIDGGVLRWTGGSTTTSRLFTIGTNNATIDFAGSGPLQFGGDVLTDPSILDMPLGLNGSNTARTLTLTGASSTSNTNRIDYAITDNGAGATSVTKSGAMTVALVGNNTYSGVTTINEGRLYIFNGNALGSTAGGTVVNAGGQLRVDGVVVGNESLTISGSGSATSEGALRVNSGPLSSVSTWGGTVTLAADATIFAGSSLGLIIDVPGSGTGTGINLGGNALQFTNAGTIEIKDNIVGTGGIAKRGSGPLILSASTSYTGETVISVGQVVAQANGALGSTSRVIASGTSGGRLQFQGGFNAGDRPLTTYGDAVENVSGNNTYAGPVTIGQNTRLISTSGTLTFSNTITGSDAPITFSGNGTTVISGNVGAGITTLNVNNYNFGNSPCLLVITGSNPNYTGTVAVNDGSLQLGDGGTTGSFPTTVALTLGGSVGGSQALIVKRSNTVTQGVDFIGSAISGQGGFIQAGSGTTILNAVNTYKGPTKVLAGTLFINGDHRFNVPGAVTVEAGGTLGGIGFVGGAVTISGVLSPGTSPGVLTVPSVTLGASSTSLFEINGTSRGTGYDGLDVSGASGLTYGGTLSLVFGNGSAFPASTILDLFAFTGVPSGAFSSVTSTGFYTGEWTLSGDDWLLESGGQTLTFSQTTGDLVVVPEPSTLMLLSGLAVCARGLRSRRRASIRAGP